MTTFAKITKRDEKECLRQIILSALRSGDDMPGVCIVFACNTDEKSKDFSVRFYTEGGCGEVYLKAGRVLKALHDGMMETSFDAESVKIRTNLDLFGSGLWCGTLIFTVW